MNDEPDSLADSLRQLAHEALQQQGPDSHPAPETLTAYHAGELAPAAVEEVQEHLAICRHCTRLLLDLTVFLEEEAGDDEAAAAVPSAAEALAARRALPWLAAAALVAAIAVPLWTIARHLSRPPGAAVVTQLVPPEAMRGAFGTPPPETIVHADAATTVLYVQLAGEQPGLRFSVVLHPAPAGGQGAAASAVPLEVAKALDPHTLIVLLARHQLTPGRYRLWVLDGERPSAAPLGEYLLRVVAP